MAERPFAAQNVFNDDATSLARVDPVAEKALAEEHYAQKLANQLNYSNKAYKYESGGTAPQLFGYPSIGAKGPTGIGYGGCTPSERLLFHWNVATTPFYIVGATVPNKNVWFVKGTEGEGTKAEELRAAGSNTSLGSHFESVPMPLPSAIVAGFDTIEAAISSSKKELAGITSIKSLCVGARISGLGLEPGTTIESVSGNTATFSPEAKEERAATKFEVIGTPWSEGTDKHMEIWRPSTDEYWEMWGTSIWAAPSWKASTAYALHNVVLSEGKLYECIKAMTAGEDVKPPEATHWKLMPCLNGDYKFAYGSYTNEASKWNGICPHEWGAKACGFAAIGGSLALEDLTSILKGGKIGHALGVNAVCTKTGALAPSGRKGDEHLNLTSIPKFKAKIPASKKQLEGINTFMYLAEGAELVTGNGIGAGTFIGTINESAKTAQLVNEKGEAKLAESEHAEAEYELVNQSAGGSGLKDAVPEGAWFAFPSSFTATVAGLTRATEPLLYEIHESIREHGLYVMDSAALNCSICFEDPRILGSPYAGEEVNPFYAYKGASPSETKIKEYVNNHVPESWNNPAAKELKESLEGSSNPLQKLQLQMLEQLAPRSS